VQCGYCTPGFIMSVKVLLDRTKNPTPEDIEEAVSGNICRCTGYNKIVDAIHLAAQKL
jgi:aerobic-type carbon monoxide dehydrogenase small subunit (CoxS/CutS family)